MEQRAPWDSLTSPPSYESAMLGQPYVIAPMTPYPYPFPTPDNTTLHHYVYGCSSSTNSGSSQLSTAPSAPPFSPPPTSVTVPPSSRRLPVPPPPPSSTSLPVGPNEVHYWRHHGLDLLLSTNYIHITKRRDDKYSITDNTKSLLYTTTIDMETTCCCCSSPRGPGITFHLASRNKQQVLTIQQFTHNSCCSAREMEVNVSLPSNVALGTVEGKGSHFTLSNQSGDVLCYLDQENDCCNCCPVPFKVIPASFPHDVGTVDQCGQGTMVTFPMVLDVATRTLLVAFALSQQYMREEDAKRSTS
ncbi:hypothetical protein Pmani_023630 [Petrolisthes manimaculis]|uniref:Phospholipid scramblase n=1 Tax=Petrolisthes manimaculis TaxID=1843537 RepID=A0AAE1PC06_9EUCA|nr:hypothetical protein Pmani_023630 [Petrolisthes manimaculis]